MKVTKYAKSKATYYIDAESGEIMDEVVSNDDKVFFKDSGFGMLYMEFYSLSLSPAELNAALMAFRYCKFNTNIINLDVDRKTYNNFYKILPRLVTRHVVIKVGRGEYMVNPVYYWKGHSANRFTTLKELYNTHKYIFNESD